MSDLSPAAQALDEDLRCLMGGALFGSLAVKERVWGAAEGPPRTVEESRDRYRVPIVDAFAASGAETLAEFPERVRWLSASVTNLNKGLDASTAELLRRKDRIEHLIHERDMAKAEADRYHEELTALRESEHKAKMEVQALRKENADRKQLAADQQNAIESRVSESAHLRDLYGRTLTERDQARTSADCLRVMLAGAPGGQLLAEVEQARANLANRVAELVKENADLRHGIRRLCRILGKAMAGDL